MCKNHRVPTCNSAKKLNSSYVEPLEIMDEASYGWWQKLFNWSIQEYVMNFEPISA